MTKILKSLPYVLAGLLVVGSVVMASISNPTSGTGITSLGGLSGATQTFVNGTNVTMSSAGTEHTLGWTGDLAVADGGTGAGTHTTGQLLVGAGTGAITSTSTANLKASMLLNLVENTAISAWAGSGNLVTLGTITSGTWNGTDVAVSAGGTGLGTVGTNQLLTGNGTSALTSEANLVFDGTNLGVGSTTPQREISVTGAIVSEECALTDGATVTFNLDTCNSGVVTLGGNRTIDFTNETQALGQSVRLTVCQDGTGSRTLVHDAAVLWAGGTAPTLTTTANKCDVLAGFVTNATGTPVILLDAVANF